MKIDHLLATLLLLRKGAVGQKLLAVGSPKQGWVCSVLELLALITEARYWRLK
jgi:hypothetical protein